jgi:very-short-patch-repair endonuclease
MGGKMHQRSSSELWRLVRRQHGVVTRAQLLAHGYSRHAIEHRLAKGRLYRVHEGVYAVGRPELTRYGIWMAGVLACGEAAVLSHLHAAALWEIRTYAAGPIHVSVPLPRQVNRPGIVIHRRKALTDDDLTTHHNIPVTTPIATLVDIAPTLTRDEREAAINEADKRKLVNPPTLRAALDEAVPRPGTAILRNTLDHRTFTLTDTKLERLFLPLARRAGLPKPRTQEWIHGFKVDFHWPDLNLVVETDGLTYHRTPAEQATDRVRDQTHLAAGLTPLRFTRAQVKFEPAYVQATLTAVAYAAGRVEGSDPSRR